MSLSVISQLLLIRFWWNFKCMFLGTSITESYCYSDICPGNICHGDICPYQKYLSSYWSDFAQTLNEGSWDHLTNANCLGDIFPGNIFPSHNCLSIYITLGAIPASSVQCLSQILNLECCKSDVFGVRSKVALLQEKITTGNDILMQHDWVVPHILFSRLIMQKLLLNYLLLFV